MKRLVSGVAWVVLAAILSTGAAYAELPVSTTRSWELPSVNNSSSALNTTGPQRLSLQEKTLAANWGLTPAEYQQYQYDMTETPDSVFYQAGQTAPLWVLAAHAENNPALFQHYIQQSVKIAYRETARMLKVSTAFAIAAHQLYPNQYPVMTAQMHAGELQAGDSIRLYCTLHSPTCSNILAIVVKRIEQVPHTRLDVFVVGALNRGQIEHFAASNQLPLHLVNQGVVTLNFGDQAFQQQTVDSGLNNPLPLPYLTVVRHGHQIPVNLVKSS